MNRTAACPRSIIASLLLFLAATTLHAQSTADSLERALAFVRDADSCAVLLERLGGALSREGDVIGAMEFWKQAEKEHAALHDNIARARVCRYIAALCRQRYNTAETLLWYRKSVQLDLEAGALASAAHCFRVVGGTWRVLDDLARAMEAYEQSARLYEQIGNKAGLGFAYINIGDMHTCKGDFTRSMQYFHRALALGKETGNKGLLALSYWYIGREYDFQHRQDEGLVYMDSSLAVREEIGNLRDVQFTLMIIAALCTNSGKYERAKEYLARSMALADSLGDRGRIADVLYSFARPYREQGDMVTAIDYALQSLDIYREIGDLRNEDTMLRKIATLYSRVGKYDSAKTLFDEALVITERLGSRGRIRWHYQDLAAHYARMGEFDSAIAMQASHMALNDSVYNSETFSSINTLTAALEADSRERRIELLSTAREVDSLRLLQRARELEQQRLLLRQRQAERSLLAQERHIQQLKIAQAADTLALRTQAIARGRLEAQRQRQKISLQQAELAQEELLRNALAAGFLVTLVLAVLFMRNLRRRRETAELRTEAAELRVRAVEAQALAQQADIAREEHAQRRQFTARLIASQEQERRRIAGALHDGIGQDLLIIKHRALMAQDDAARRDEHLKDIMEIAVEGIEDVRRLCRDLRPYQLERVGLTETLRGMLLSIDESTSLEVHANIGDIDGLIPAEREIDLYRVVQEGMNNIIKHAGATRADVHLERVNGSLRLRLRDDGTGFEIAATKAGAPLGMGLEDMTERMHLLGGHLRIESAAGRGTLLEATVPLGEDGSQAVPEALPEKAVLAGTIDVRVTVREETEALLKEEEGENA